MTTTDIRLAAELAGQAGQRLLGLRAESGLTGAELGKKGDALANDFLLERLAGQRGADTVLSEEAKDDRARLAAERVWIVDPLDGTKEYAKGRSDWAVHVALWEAGAGITAAAVAQPDLDTVHASGQSASAAEPPAVPRILVSASRPPEFADAVAREVGGALVPMGSAGAKTMAVLRGEAEIYVHAGGQWEWDSAAPVGVALAAGLHASRIDGAPLRYNREDPYLPDLVVCRPEFAGRVLAAIGA